MPSQKRKKTNTLTGRTDYIDPKNYGEYGAEFKGGRPTYILKSVDSDRVLVVKSTQSKTLTTKDIKGYLEFVNADGQRSWLNLNTTTGYEIIKKSTIYNDLENLNDDIVLDAKQHKKLQEYYKSNLLPGI